MKKWPQGLDVIVCHCVGTCLFTFVPLLPEGVLCVWHAVSVVMTI